MQPNDLAEKKRVKIDGEEIPGLVFTGELVIEKGTIEVPEFKKIRIIQNGVTKIPTYEMRYKIKRGNQTLNFFKDWYFKDEIKDVLIIRTDAHGDEFARTLLPDSECIRYSEPQGDAAAPIYAQIAMLFVPWDLVPITTAT